MKQNNSRRLPAGSIMNSAMGLLARRNHTEKELAVKLQQRGYDEEAIRDAISTCKRLKYIDDTLTADLFVVECKRKCYGPLRIRHAMQKKGFSSEDIAKALNSGYSLDEEVQNAKTAALKKSSGPLSKIDPAARKQKLYTYLYSRGFSAEAISKALSEK